MRLRYFGAAIALLGCACIARADIQTIGEYNGTGTYHDPGPYQPTTVIGTFNILPGDSAITISGTFGNSAVSSSSGVNVYLGDLLVASCVQFSSCYNFTTPWTDTLSSADIAALGTGTVDLSVTQTSQLTIRLGTTTLDQTGLAATPEPSSFAMLGTGLLGVAGLIRRRLPLRT